MTNEKIKLSHFLALVLQMVAKKPFIFSLPKAIWGKPCIIRQTKNERYAMAFLLTTNGEILIGSTI